MSAVAAIGAHLLCLQGGLNSCLFSRYSLLSPCFHSARVPSFAQTPSSTALLREPVYIRYTRRNSSHLGSRLTIALCLSCIEELSVADIILQTIVQIYTVYTKI